MHSVAFGPPIVNDCYLVFANQSFNVTIAHDTSEIRIRYVYMHVCDEHIHMYQRGQYVRVVPSGSTVRVHCVRVIVCVQTKRKYHSYSWNEQTESQRNRNAEETEEHEAEQSGSTHGAER